MGWRRLHVVLDLVDGLGLVLGLLEGEGVLELPRELAVGREGEAGDGLARPRRAAAARPAISTTALRARVLTVCQCVPPSLSSAGAPAPAPM